MTISQQLLQKARIRMFEKIDNAVVHEQEFVTFQELLLAEGKIEQDFSVKAWGLLEQVIQYPFDEFAYIKKDSVPENPLEIKDDELFIIFLSCVTEVIDEENLTYNEINALPIGFRIAYFLLSWDEAGGFMMWVMGQQEQEFGFVQSVAQVYHLVDLKKESKAIYKALVYADPDGAKYDLDKALIAYTYVHGHMNNEVEKRLTRINQFLLNTKKRSQIFCHKDKDR